MQVSEGPSKTIKVCHTHAMHTFIHIALVPGLYVFRFTDLSKDYPGFIESLHYLQYLYRPRNDFEFWHAKTAPLDPKSHSLRCPYLADNDEFYQYCQQHELLHAELGRDTMVKASEGVWGRHHEKALVSIVTETLRTTSADSPFSIQALWYDASKKESKPSHKDPKCYPIIASLNLKGEATLTMTSGNRKARVELGEGDLYILSGAAATEWYHDVSTPHGGKDRVVLVLRYLREDIVEKVEKHLSEMKKKTNGTNENTRIKRPRAAHLMR